jgi:hypothetical protein
MQVLLLLLLLLSDSFVFGLQPMFHYSTPYAVAWVVVSIVLMALPYFRKTKWMDESKWSNSDRTLWL